MTHPNLEDITLEGIFYALSDKTRLRIIANLYKEKSITLNCMQAMCGIDNIPASTTSHHFRVLRECGIIRSVREGKECHSQLRLDELDQKFPGLLQMTMNNWSE
tara:strand:+ start:40 stop:351 length:312 start_codon:yes stop_codon:yes gene_type:complete